MALASRTDLEPLRSLVAPDLVFPAQQMKLDWLVKSLATSILTY